MADDGDFGGEEFVDGDEQAAHDAAEGVGDDRAGVLDDLGVAVAEVHGPREKLDEAGVHAGEDNQLLVGEGIGKEWLVFPLPDEPGVVLLDFR